MFFTLPQEIHEVSKGLDKSLRNLNTGCKIGKEYLGHFIAVAEVTEPNSGLATTGARGDVSRYLEKMEQLFQGEKFLKQNSHFKDSLQYTGKIITAENVIRHNLEEEFINLMCSNAGEERQGLLEQGLAKAIATENTEWKGGVLVEKVDYVEKINWGSDPLQEAARDTRYRHKVEKLQPTEQEVTNVKDLVRLLSLFKSEMFVDTYKYYRTIAFEKQHEASMRFYIDEDNVFRCTNTVKYLAGEYCCISHMANFLHSLQKERDMAEKCVPGPHFIGTFVDIVEPTVGEFCGCADKYCCNRLEESPSAVFIMLDVLRVWGASKAAFYQSLDLPTTGESYLEMLHSQTTSLVKKVSKVSKIDAIANNAFSRRNEWDDADQHFMRSSPYPHCLSTVRYAWCD